jgi:hypothetical protein
MPRWPRELRRALDASAMLRQAVTEVVDNLTGTADGGIFCGTISFDSICSEPHAWGSLSFGRHQAARPSVGFCPAFSNIRSKATFGTTKRCPNRMVGISPRLAASYAALRDSPSFRPASGTVNVSTSDMAR